MGAQPYKKTNFFTGSLITQMIPEFSNVIIISVIFLSLLNRLLKRYLYIKDNIFGNIVFGEFISYLSLLEALILFSPAQYMTHIPEWLTDILDS